MGENYVEGGNVLSKSIVFRLSNYAEQSDFLKILSDNFGAKGCVEGGLVILQYF